MPNLLNKPYYAPPPVLPPGDPNILMLLHGDGPDGSNVITDSSVYGHVQQNLGAVNTNTDGVFGGSCINFATGGTDFVYDTEFTLGTSDFTFDTWYKPTGNFGSTGFEQATNTFSLPGSSTQVGLYMYRSYSWFYGYNYTGIGIGYFYNAGSGNSFSGQAKTWINLSGWHHIAMVRNAGTVTIYLDGVTASTFTNTASIGDLASNPLFGGSYNNYLMDEVRLTNDVRWTTDFTPPSSPYTV